MRDMEFMEQMEQELAVVAEEEVTPHQRKQQQQVTSRIVQMIATVTATPIWDNPQRRK